MLQQLVSSTFPEVNFKFDIVNVENIDWVLHVQETWEPQVIGDLTIRFPWHDQAQTTTKEELVLEGGAAFGTGDHPTTRLCCRWLQRNIATTGNAGTD